MTSQKISMFSTHKPEQVFAYKHDIPILFSEFISDVRILSEHLDNKHGDVLISCQSRYSFSVALLATWVANKIAILLSSTNKEMLNNISAISTIAYYCDDVWAKISRQDQQNLAGQETIFYFYPEQLAVRLFTSGSTGEPAMIEKTIGNLWFEVESLQQTLDWVDSPLVASVPAYHLYGLTFSVLLPWYLGTPLVDAMPLHADEVVACFNQTGAKILITVPIHLKALMNSDVCLKHKQCIVSAAPLPVELAKIFMRKYDAHALEVYGSSETGIVAYRKQLKNEAWTCFNQVSVSVNENSLLDISSPFVYPQTPNLSKNNLFCSSDKAVLHDDKHFNLEGRMDAIVKIAGKRISLLNIEQSLMRCQGVQDAVVIAMPAKSTVRDWAIWAVIAVEDEQYGDILKIKRELRKWVDGVAIPRRMLKLTKLPREANGKLPKKSVMELFKYV
ncbi:MAG: class I adenylate-forming enzyme family protein [Mariprofundales bacterium]